MSAASGSAPSDGAGPVGAAPGGQPQRTRLAWRRTCLEATGVSLLGLRFAPEVLGGPGAAVAAGLLVAVLVLWTAAAHRARRIERAWSREGAGARLPGGRLLLLCAGLVTLLGVGALVRLIPLG